jgi:hypothetical protein
MTFPPPARLLPTLRRSLRTRSERGSPASAAIAMREEEKA